MRTCKPEVIYSHIINDLQILENGIDIVTAEGVKKVHFVLSLLIGDNLGLNKLLGFVSSFNGHRFCRVCRRTISQTKCDYEQIDSSLRNKQNYERDLKRNNASLTGVKTTCIFNELKYFHITQNFYFDLMHDVLEGICKYDVCQILVCLIDEKIIDLNTLNSRKKLFPFAKLDSGNLACNIEMKKLRDNSLKMTASEVLCFIRFLPLMIGDLVPTTNKYWNLLTKLITIVDFLFKTSFSNDDLESLRILIKEHHEIYIKLFDKTLKPKHHFWVHYPTAISQCGPLRYSWVMRFESKHQKAKSYLNSITSRKNASRSLALKQALQFSHFLMIYKNGIPPPFDKNQFTYENIYKIKELQNVSIRDYPFEENILVSRNVNFNGINYETNCYLMNNLDLFLCKIILICTVSDKLYIICNQVQIKKFFQSFEIGKTNMTVLIKEMYYFTSAPMHLYQINNGKTYAKYKEL